MATSKFFEKLKFEVGKSPGEQKPEKVVVWDPDKLKAAYVKIEAELTKIKNGTSKYVPRPIDPSHFGFPADNAIKIFITDPSDKLFEGIIGISVQDWGQRAGDYFVELLKTAREERLND